MNTIKRVALAVHKTLVKHVLARSEIEGSRGHSTQPVESPCSSENRCRFENRPSPQMTIHLGNGDFSTGNYVIPVSRTTIDISRVGMSSMGHDTEAAGLAGSIQDLTH